jgi:periplasmic protein CpxP/Spy
MKGELMKSRFVLSCFVLVYILAGVAYSQQKPPREPPREEMLKHLTEKLKLTDDQVEKVELILNTTKNKMDILKEKMGNEKDKLMDEMQDIRKNEDKEIEKVLTDEQKKLFADLKKERSERRPPMGDRQGPPPQMGERPGGQF